MSDGLVYDVAAHLLDCACTRLGDDCPGRHCVVPGSVVSVENCCDGNAGGQLTVNVVQRYPSIQFPTNATGTAANCPPTYIVNVYQLSIYRCMPVGSGQHAPTCQQLDLAAQRSFLDMERLWDGVSCCLTDKDSMGALIGGPYAWSVGSQQSVSPEGGCVGSTLQVAIGISCALEC